MCIKLSVVSPEFKIVSQNPKIDRNWLLVGKCFLPEPKVLVTRRGKLECKITFQSIVRARGIATSGGKFVCIPCNHR